MLTIKMLSDKSLVITKAINIYQRQSLVDNFQILVPATYGDVDLTNFNAVIEYVDPAKTAHMEILTRDEELYQEQFLRYTLNMNSHFTYMAGDNIMKLTLSYYDESTNQQYVLKTGEVTVTVLELKDYFVYTDDESFASIDRKIMELQVQADKLTAAAEIYATKVPDDLSLNDDALLQLTVNGSVLGMGVQLAKPVDEGDGKDDGIIDLNTQPSEDEDEDENLVAVIDL